MIKTSVLQTSKNVYQFVSPSWLVSFGVFITIHYFFDTVRNEAPKNKFLYRRPNTQETNMWFEQALNFDQWKTSGKLQAHKKLIMDCLQIYRE